MVKEGRLYGKIRALAAENESLKELLISIIFAHGGAYLLPRMEMPSEFVLQPRQVDEGVILRLIVVPPGQHIITPEQEGEEDDTESDTPSGRIIIP